MRVFWLWCFRVWTNTPEASLEDTDRSWKTFSDRMRTHLLRHPLLHRTCALRWPKLQGPPPSSTARVGRFRGLAFRRRRHQLRFAYPRPPPQAQRRRRSQLHLARFSRALSGWVGRAGARAQLRPYRQRQNHDRLGRLSRAPRHRRHMGLNLIQGQGPHSCTRRV